MDTGRTPEGYRRITGGIPEKYRKDTGGTLEGYGRDTGATTKGRQTLYPTPWQYSLSRACYAKA